MRWWRDDYSTQWFPSDLKMSYAVQYSINQQWDQYKQTVNRNQTVIYIQVIYVSISVHQRQKNHFIFIVGLSVCMMDHKVTERFMFRFKPDIKPDCTYKSSLTQWGGWTIIICTIWCKSPSNPADILIHVHVQSRQSKLWRELFRTCVTSGRWPHWQVHCFWWRVQPSHPADRFCSGSQSPTILFLWRGQEALHTSITFFLS